MTTPGIGGSTGFAETLERAIAAQPLTLERIAARLKAAGTPASITTLSYWQTGRSHPTRQKSRLVLAELDYILGLAPGTLVAALDKCPTYQAEGVVPAPVRVRELLAEMGLEMTPSWHRLHCRNRLILDERGRETTQRAYTFMRAEIDGAQEWPIVLQQEHGLPGATASVRSISSVEIADLRIDSEQRLTVAKARLSRPVPRGTYVAAEWEISWGAMCQPTKDMLIGLPRKADHAVLEVVFSGLRPRRCQRIFQAPDDDEIQTFDDVGYFSNLAQVALDEPAAGQHGLQFHWDE